MWFGGRYGALYPVGKGLNTFGAWRQLNSIAFRCLIALVVKPTNATEGIKS